MEPVLFFEPKLKVAFAYCPSSGGVFQLDEGEYRAVLEGTEEGKALIGEMRSYTGQHYSFQDFVGHLNSLGITHERLSRPATANLELTLRCNLNCKHCIVSAGEPKENELTTSEWLRLVDGLGSLQYTLTGGEPLMHPGFGEIVEAIKGRGAAVKILTNGTLVPENLNAFEGLDGRDVVQVSLDGTEEVNDSIRGRGTFKRVVSAIKALAEAGVNVQVSFTLLPENKADLVPLYREVSGLGVKAFNVGRGLPLGRQGKAVPYREYLAAVEGLRDVAKEVGVPVAGGQLGDPLPVEPEAVYSCEAGTSSLFVSSTGDVYPCLLFRWSDFRMGNVREEDIQEIWEKGDWERLRRNLGGTRCASCPLFGACRGGCPGEALLFSGSLDAPAPSCRWEEG